VTLTCGRNNGHFTKSYSLSPASSSYPSPTAAAGLHTLRMLCHNLGRANLNKVPRGHQSFKLFISMLHPIPLPFRSGFDIHFFLASIYCRQYPKSVRHDEVSIGPRVGMAAIHTPHHRYRHYSHGHYRQAES
jgi:hypothetical protein